MKRSLFAGKVKRIHFIGIGGIGMSGMAELLHKLGFNISGSDQNRSERTESLKHLAENHIVPNIQEINQPIF